MEERVVCELTTEVPPCKSSVRCPCVRCNLEGNQSYCKHLVRLAKKYKRDVEEGKSPSLLSYIPEMMEKFSSFEMKGIDSLFADYNALPKYFPSNPTLKECVRRETSTLEKFDTDDGMIIRKVLEGEEEVLIHKQVYDFLLSDPYMKDMVPAFLGIGEGEPSENRCSYYMERVEGVTLLHALREGMSGDNLLITICSIHSLLARLRRVLGFVHCDLKLDNIYLRGYGEGKEWKVPIVIERQGTTVTLPFLPVLLDFGLASTYKYSCSSQALSPYVNEVSDVIMLYRQLDMEVEDDHPFAIAAERIKKACGDEWRKAEFIPPLPLRFPQLTHEAMMKLYMSTK